ncbi:MAG: FAD binding domain-containing protein [Acidobacteriota bacterium]|nr:FAD binding domain-containing protein [Acidobacteriota bacterium]
MLRLPAFRYFAPDRLDELLRLLASEGPGTRVVAGGTDLWPNMKRRHQRAETVASLMRIAELKGIDDSHEEVSIGSATVLAELAANPMIRARYPMLARAVSSISSPPLRNMGTIGGNLLLDTRCTYYNQTEEWRQSIDYCMKEAGTVCWVAPSSPRCWAHSASDAAPALAALDARVVLNSSDGEREVPLLDLYRDDGIDYLTITPNEVLTRVLLPSDSDQTQCSGAFWKLRRRGSIDFAVLSVAVAVWRNAAGIVERARILLGAVSSRPAEAREAAEHLIGNQPSAERIGEAAQLARKAATPLDNTDFKAQWRGLMVERYAEAALAEALGFSNSRFRPPHPEIST